MTFLKAIVAAIVAAAGSLGAASTTGHLTLAEILGAVAATATAFSAVYIVPNKPAAPAGDPSAK